MIEIIFLGTGQAVPTERRNHTGILLKYKDEVILIDSGEGIQRQFRKAKINPCKLTKILITHWHGDHILGIPGLLQTLALNNYSRTLDIYGPQGTKRYMEIILGMFVFVGKIKINIHEIIKEGIFFENDFQLEAYKLEHSAPCLAYIFKEKDKRRILIEKIKKFKIEGKIIGKLQKGEVVEINGKKIKPDDVSYVQKGKKIAVILDTGIFEGCYKIAENADLLISEATYSKELEEKAREYNHMTAEDAAEIAKKAGVKKLILTHLSQRYEKDDGKILKEARKIFKNTEIAEDFMKTEV